MLLDDALAHGSLGMSTNWFDTDRNRELVPSRFVRRPPSSTRSSTCSPATRTPRCRSSRAARPTVAACWRSRWRAVCRCCRSATAWAAITDDRPPGVPASAAAPSRSARGSGSRAHRGGRRARVARDDQRPRREQARSARRRRVARAGAPRLGPPARRAERVPQGAAARADPLRLRERHRPGGHLAERPRRAARPASVGRAGRLGARERHRVALHEALGPAAGHPGSRWTSGSKAAFDDPYTLIGGTDAGAHLKMFCGAGANLYVLTHWARDEAAVSIEQAVHCMTQRNAAFFSLHDRGVIETGKRGDLAVFALDEIETARLRRAPTTCPTADGASRGRARASAPRSSAARPPCSTASPPAHAPPPSATPSAPPARPERNRRQLDGAIRPFVDAGSPVLVQLGGRLGAAATVWETMRRPIVRSRALGLVAAAVGGRRRCALERRRERRGHGRASLRSAPRSPISDQAAVVVDRRRREGRVGLDHAAGSRSVPRSPSRSASSPAATSSSCAASFAVRQRLVRASRRAPPLVPAMQLF